MKAGTRPATVPELLSQMEERIRRLEMALAAAQRDVAALKAAQAPAPEPTV